jgi:hypothetical protein
MRLKNLEKYRTGGVGSNMQLSIPLPKTPEGRVYRYSPNERAHPRHFLLGDRVEGFQQPETLTPRMTHMPGTPGTICPYSGVADDDDAFMHPDDIAAAKEIVAHAATTDVADAFHGIFESLARKSSGNKFIQWKVGPKPQQKPKPRFARRDLLRELVCDECGRDYGVYAISLFCPDCGTPNIHLHFSREVELVREQVELVGKLSAGQREFAYRLLGNAHEDVLTAFEATLKTVYLYKVAVRPPNAAEVKPIGNAFQNIERGRKRFAEFNFDQFGSLSPEALAVLILNIQKRHVIGHNLGVADAAFAEHAADARLGETVPLVGEDILQFADICQMVVDHIDAWLANGAPPSNKETRLTKPIVVPATKEPAVLRMGELGQLAISIGLWISAQSKEGFDEFVSEDSLKEAFPDANIDDLAFAVAELAKDGYLSTTPLLSSRIPRILTTMEFFIAFDPHAVKSDPASDVVTVIELVLSEKKITSAEELHSATGWPLRHFNPAFAYMISLIDDKRILRGGVSDYPARGFLLVDEDKVELKRFVTRLTG